MGKKKLEEVKLIEPKQVRTVAFNKRKNGLMKKAMELSILCGVEVSLAFTHIGTDKLTVY